MFEEGLIKKKEYYSNEKGGGIWKKYSVNSQGELHGPFRMYWPDGSKKAQCEYKGGKLVGMYADFYKDGQLRLGVEFDDRGLETGLSESYWPNGKLEYEIHYKNGLEEGPYKTYWPNGQLEVECTMISGLEHGEYRMYKEDGTLDRTFQVVLGKIIKKAVMVEEVPKVSLE